MASTPYLKLYTGSQQQEKNPFYQLDLVTPVISPLDANLRKQIRHTPNFLIKALGRPHSGHRLYLRTANFGFRPAFAIIDFLAKPTSRYCLLK
jgi:hypothetical protein